MRASATPGNRSARPSPVRGPGRARDQRSRSLNLRPGASCGTSSRQHVLRRTIAGGGDEGGGGQRRNEESGAEIATHRETDGHRLAGGIGNGLGSWVGRQGGDNGTGAVGDGFAERSGVGESAFVETVTEADLPYLSGSNFGD